MLDLLESDGLIAGNVSTFDVRLTNSGENWVHEKEAEERAGEAAEAARKEETIGGRRPPGPRNAPNSPNPSV